MYVGTILCRLALMSETVSGKEEYSPHIIMLCYVDELSRMINNVHVGCFDGTILVNYLMYADNLELLSPSAAGPSLLLPICSTYGIEYDVMYNSANVMFLYFVVNY